MISIIDVYFSSSILIPEGQIDKVQDARFGSSVACLGKPDANIKTTLVIIGAPYYADYGAVFVYRALEGETSLKLTQKIESPRQSLGFGMKLSDVGKEGNTLDSIGVGVGIGSPDVSTSWYVRTKPVPKFEDVSVISHTPATIDLNRFSELKVTVNPRIRFSAANRLIGEVVQSWRRPLLGPSPG